MRSNIVLRNNPRAKSLQNKSSGDIDDDESTGEHSDKASKARKIRTKKLWITFSLTCIFSLAPMLFQNYIWTQPSKKGGKKQVGNGMSSSNAKSVGISSKDGPILSKNVYTRNNMVSNKNKVLIKSNLRNSATNIISPQMNANTVKTPSTPQVPAKTKSSAIKELGPKKQGSFSCKSGIHNLDTVTETIKKDIAYWNDIPIDLTYQSPYIDSTSEEKYFTFEKDQAGWNNNRMAFENAILFAVVTGRTLVVPPSSIFPLMTDRGHVYKRQKNFFSFEDIFNLDSIPSLKHITMKEFLEKVAKKSKLKNRKTNQVEYPAKTEYDSEKLEPLHDYLRNVGYPLDWRPRKCIGVFPSTKGDAGVTRMQKLFDAIVNKKNGNGMPQPFHYTDKPTNVNASVLERLREMVAQRDTLCIYDTTLQNELLIHMRMELNFRQEIKSYRWLAPFYSFFFFENYKVDLWAKRFIRDHVRYQDEIMCKAATIVGKIKERARSRNPISNPNGDYYAFHIRRNDFQGQYAQTAANGTTILELSTAYIPVGSTVFIATDEKEESFFAPFHDKYDVLLLKDFESDLTGDDYINTNLYGQIDQVIASRSFVFLGTFLSTFTAYINRLRGYYSLRDKAPPGYELGQLKNVIHFLPTYATFEMWQYKAVASPFWFREFPIGWRDIDFGVEEGNSITNWDDEYIKKTMIDAGMLNVSAVGVP